jgi:hypothetical protein
MSQGGLDSEFSLDCHLLFTCFLGMILGELSSQQKSFTSSNPLSSLKFSLDSYLLFICFLLAFAIK